MELIGLLVLLTVVLSAILGFFCGLIALLDEKTINQSWSLFVHVFIVGLLGSLVSSVAGLIIGYVAAAFTPAAGTLAVAFYGIEKLVSFIIAFLICWLLGIVAGAIKGANYYCAQKK